MKNNLKARLLLLVLLLIPTLSFGSEPPFKLPELKKLAKVRSAEIQTSKGNIYLELFPEIAPWHVANLKYLADQGFYQNLKFHLHEPGYVIQGGAPTKEMNSGPGYTLPPEFSEKEHLSGSLVMVRKPNDLDFEHTRRSHGSQFRILLKAVPSMNGTHTNFGRVIKGMDVARALKKGDLIKNITVYVKS